MAICTCATCRSTLRPQRRSGSCRDSIWGYQPRCRRHCVLHEGIVRDSVEVFVSSHDDFSWLSQDALNLLFLGDTNRVVAALAPGFIYPIQHLLTLPLRRLQ